MQDDADQNLPRGAPSLGDSLEIIIATEHMACS
jgi:hypothetical protein